VLFGHYQIICAAELATPVPSVSETGTAVIMDQDVDFKPFTEAEYQELERLALRRFSLAVAEGLLDAPPQSQIGHGPGMLKPPTFRRPTDQRQL
jgi:hypothetical protein